MGVSDFERKLEKYAEIIVRIGLNLQPGQRLLVGPSSSLVRGAPFESAPLIRHVVAQAYQAGARFVDVAWDDEQLLLTRFAHAPRDSFDEISRWPVDAATEYARHGDALLVVHAPDPDLLAGQDPALISTLRQASYRYRAALTEMISQNATNWLVIATPTARWAARVFPDLPVEQQQPALWDAIFTMCRVDQDDPVAGWHEHLARLAAQRERLNRKRYAALHLTGPGTDLTIGLPDGHIWRSGGLTAQNGITFTANVPTEEVFTLPHKDRVDGIVTATRPLNLGGSLIDGFSLTFEAGRVVEARADTGQDALLSLLDTDAGARGIGEIALVPHDSPISQSGLLFYNILFDENASDHIALGDGYKFCLEGGESMSNEAFAAAGGNSSLAHVDFMVGSGAMNVDGLTASGAVEPIMRAGEWVAAV
jgi:aminopeptidase